MAARSSARRSLLVAWRRKAVGRCDGAAVIGDAQIGETPVLYLHRNGGGPGVQGVFQQLLGHAGRALHHLAGGNEVGYVRV